MNKIENKKVEIKIPSDLNCETCAVVNEMAEMNCTRTYSECRSYNKHLWNKIDKQLNSIRKSIFEDVLTFDPFSEMEA